MASQRITPPWNYLHDATATSLESYELSRLNHAANIRREVGALIEQWIEDTAQALLARWVREDRMIRAATCPQAELPFAAPRSAQRVLPGLPRRIRAGGRARDEQ